MPQPSPFKMFWEILNPPSLVTADLTAKLFARMKSGKLILGFRSKEQGEKRRGRGCSQCVTPVKEDTGYTAIESRTTDLSSFTSVISFDLKKRAEDMTFWYPRPLCCQSLLNSRMIAGNRCKNDVY
ncbi:hypothetical protein CVT25_002527 [Psilocybe cyanescens]|uniref:Uncharacterized protein n=1 Tax=Psilocybe cyanescens TaxID=93625 RepID=A0A409XUQ9_PSICY|nr:hypothetical protein CVT25_002527 [Psilocybe cyanescens]